MLSTLHERGRHKFDPSHRDRPGQIGRRFAEGADQPDFPGPCCAGRAGGHRENPADAPRNARRPWTGAARRPASTRAGAHPPGRPATALAHRGLIRHDDRPTRWSRLRGRGGFSWWGSPLSTRCLARGANDDRAADSRGSDQTESLDRSWNPSRTGGVLSLIDFPGRTPTPRESPAGFVAVCVPAHVRRRSGEPPPQVIGCAPMSLSVSSRQPLTTLFVGHMESDDLQCTKS